MGKRSKIKEIVPPQKDFPVTKSTNETNELVLSFQYLDITNKYSMDNISDNRMRNKLENDLKNKLKQYCSYSNFKKKITSDTKFRKDNHIHPIDWDSKIRENCFTNLDKSLMEEIRDDCWQLGIDNQGFRIHGFFIGNTFYIVWLDASHDMYHRK